MADGTSGTKSFMSWEERSHGRASSPWRSRVAPALHQMVSVYVSHTIFQVVRRHKLANGVRKECMFAPLRAALAITLTIHATTRRNDNIRMNLDLHQRCRHRRCRWNLQSCPTKPCLNLTLQKSQQLTSFAKQPAHIYTGDMQFQPQASSSSSSSSSSSRIDNKECVDLPTNSNLDDIGVFCIEIYSGTAGLTASLRKVGFQNSFGVDRNVKSGCRAPVIKVDVASSMDLVKSWIQHPNCAYLHFCVPCGTASRAREIFIPNGPVPNRTEAEPDGISSLGDRNMERVELANSIYATDCLLILFCTFSWETRVN